MAFRAVRLAAIAPSFAIASGILEQEGINLSPNKIRNLVSTVGNVNFSDRVNLLLNDDSSSPFENQRVLISVDGGCLRQRKNKRGPIPKDKKQHKEAINSKHPSGKYGSQRINSYLTILMRSALLQKPPGLLFFSPDQTLCMANIQIPLKWVDSSEMIRYSSWAKFFSRIK